MLQRKHSEHQTSDPSSSSSQNHQNLKINSLKVLLVKRLKDTLQNERGRRHLKTASILTHHLLKVHQVAVERLTAFMEERQIWRNRAELYWRFRFKSLPRAAIGHARK